MECINTWQDEIGGIQTKVADDKYIYGLAHLSRCNVRKGDKIKKGEVFAVTGNTGRSTGAHLHLTLRDRNTIKLLDPLKHLKILVLACFLFYSCSADWHIKRAMIKESPQYILNAINDKYPEFIKQQKQYVYDTIYTHLQSIDTLRVMGIRDSIFINRNNQIIKIFRHYDTIRVFADSRVDTIIRIKEVTKYVVDKNESKKSGVYFWRLFFVVLVVVVMFFIYMYYHLWHK